MIIERIDIESFGALKNVHLGINSRINVFFGGNESGKTTLASFIKFIFYGYSSIKEEKIDKNDKKLYTPWSTDKVAGSIIVHYKDKKYKIEREFAERDKKRIIDLSTNMAIQDGEEPGEFFFKMTEEVFVKTAFLKQFTSSEVGGQELSEMIQNILFTADEDINTQKTLNRLTTTRNQLATETEDGQTQGLILNLVKKRNALKKSFDDSLNDQRELFRMEGIIKDLEERILTNNAKKTELAEELENYKAYNAGKELQKIENTRKQANMLENAYKKTIAKYEYNGFVPTEEYSRELIELSTELSTKKEKLTQQMMQRQTAFEKYNECMEKNKSFNVIESAGGIEDIGNEYTEMKRSENIFRGLGITFLAVAILAFSGVAVAYFSEIFKSVLAFIVPAVLLVSAVAFFLMTGNKSKEVEEFYKSMEFESESDLAAVLDDYPDTEAQMEVFKADLDICSDHVMEAEKEFDAIYKKASELLLKWNKTPMSDDKNPDDFINCANLAAEASEEIAKSKSMYDQFKVQLDSTLQGVNENELKRLASVARTPNYEEKQIARELDFITKANESIHQQEHELQKNIAIASKLPDPVVLMTQLMFLDSTIDDLTEKYESIQLAIETLEQSCDELKNSLSPRLTELAGTIFKIATGGKYADLAVDPQLGLNFNDNLTAKDIDYLSAGTRDTAYMCLRMALLDLLFDNEMPPLICDDAFSRLDKHRFENICKIFSAVSRKSQIFIFTCHEHEVLILKSIGADVIDM